MFKTNRNRNHEDDDDTTTSSSKNHRTSSNGTGVTNISNTPRQTSTLATEDSYLLAKNENDMVPLAATSMPPSHDDEGDSFLPSTLNARMAASMNARNCLIGGANILPTLPINYFPFLTPHTSAILTAGALQPTPFGIPYMIPPYIPTNLHQGMLAGVMNPLSRASLQRQQQDDTPLPMPKIPNPRREQGRIPQQVLLPPQDQTDSPLPQDRNSPGAVTNSTTTTNTNHDADPGTCRPTMNQNGKSADRLDARIINIDDQTDLNIGPRVSREANKFTNEATNYSLMMNPNGKLDDRCDEYINSANQLDFNIRPRVSRNGKFKIVVNENKKALTEDLRLESLCLVIDFGYRYATKANRDRLAKAVMMHICYDRGFPAPIGASSVYKWFQAYENSVRGSIVRPLQTKFENRGRKKLTQEIEKQNPGYLDELYKLGSKSLAGTEESFERIAKAMNKFSRHDKRGPIELNAYHLKTWVRETYGKGSSKTVILRHNNVDSELSADEEEEDDYNEHEENPTKKKRIV